MRNIRKDTFMTAKSVEVFKACKEAEIKFDYFIVGLAIALFSYLSQNLKLQIKLGWNEKTFILCAICLLFISIIAGIKRIIYANQALNKNFTKLSNHERKEQLNKALLNNNSLVNLNTGGLFDPGFAKAELDLINKFEPKIGKSLMSLAGKASCCYHARNWTLILGVIFILFSKLIMIKF